MKVVDIHSRFLDSYTKVLLITLFITLWTFENCEGKGPDDNHHNSFKSDDIKGYFAHLGDANLVDATLLSLIGTETSETKTNHTDKSVSRSLQEKATDPTSILTQLQIQSDISISIEIIE